MDRQVFLNGIKELGLFFKTFRPSQNQIAAWYVRLKDKFEDKHMRLAVYLLTEEFKTAPGYRDLKEYLFNSRNKLRPMNIQLIRERIDSDGGYAPRSEQKWNFQREHMTALKKLIETGLAPQDAKLLKASWLTGYRNLPGYITAKEAHTILDRQDWEELVRYGVIDVHEVPYNPNNVFYPKIFESEKSNAITVEYEQYDF